MNVNLGPSHSHLYLKASHSETWFLDISFSVIAVSLDEEGATGSPASFPSPILLHERGQLELDTAIILSFPLSIQIDSVVRSPPYLSPETG